MTIDVAMAMVCVDSVYSLSFNLHRLRTITQKRNNITLNSRLLLTAAAFLPQLSVHKADNERSTGASERRGAGKWRRAATRRVVR